MEKALEPEHADTANVLENYAALSRATDRADEAEKLEARAAAIRAKQAEESNVRVGSDSDHLGTEQILPLLA